MLATLDQRQDIPAFSTPEQLAKRYGVGRTKIFEWLGSGQIRSIKLGRARRIPRAAVEEFEATLTGGEIVTR